MPDEFLNDLIYVSIPGAYYRWALLEEVRYRSARLGRIVVVPAGFECDLTSIPRLLWGFFPPMGPYAAAAVVHDYLYSVRPNDQPTSDRLTIDRVFLDAMTVLRVPLLQRVLFYAAVRLFGGRAWRN